MYWMRVAGGSMYIVGMFIFAWNIVKTWQNRPKTYQVPVVEAAPLAPKFVDPHPVIPAAGLWARFNQVQWHRAWERAPMLFTVLTTLAVIVASLFEILPTFLIKSNVPTIASVKPYTPLELAGRDLYIAEGCFNCHSQMVRPFRYETERFGDYSKPGERQGGKYPDLWHVRHFENPRAVTAKSIMPAYAHFLRKPLDFDGIQSRVDAMAMVGVPYGDAVNKAPGMAREQAKQIAAAIREQGGPDGLEDKQIVAMVAYMQRLGRDIKVTSTAQTTPKPATGAAGGSN
jgi:cytochrome c oxidase cbb3-type subunit I/II